MDIQIRKAMKKSKSNRLRQQFWTYSSEKAEKVPKSSVCGRKFGHTAGKPLKKFQKTASATTNLDIQQENRSKSSKKQRSRQNFGHTAAKRQNKFQKPASVTRILDVQQRKGKKVPKRNVCDNKFGHTRGQKLENTKYVSAKTRK